MTKKTEASRPQEKELRKKASAVARISSSSVEITRDQPRALSGDLIIQPYIRAGMNLELQKFGSGDRTRQLLLGEDADLKEEQEIELYGLELSETEDRALHAIQILLDKTNYKGNTEGEITQSSGFKFEGYIPRLSITYSEYFEAYGLERINGQYQGRQAQEALRSLKELAKTRRISYSRKRYEGAGKRSKQVIDLVRVTSPLITFLEAYKGLNEEEADQLIAGQDLPLRRQTRLIIEVSPLMVDQIDTFYLMKPTALHAEIKQLHPGKRISRSVSLFIEWLLTLNIQKIRISKDNLAEKLHLDNLIQERKRSLLDKNLQVALDTALELKYLLDYQEELTGILDMSLNPERCKRIKAKRRKDEENSSLAL